MQKTWNMYTSNLLIMSWVKQILHTPSHTICTCTLHFICIYQQVSYLSTSVIYLIVEMIANICCWSLHIAQADIRLHVFRADKILPSFSIQLIIRFDIFNISTCIFREYALRRWYDENPVGMIILHACNSKYWCTAHASNGEVVSNAVLRWEGATNEILRKLLP